MRVLQVVPRFDPEREGVSAFACALAREFERGQASSALSVALGATDRWVVDLCESEVQASGESRAAELLRRARQLESGDAVLLHYVGYGYQSRGAPFWLAAAWAQLRRERRELRLGVMFHEVYATGAPWQSSFWLLPWQRSIARSILKSTDVAVTSLTTYKERLSRLSREACVDVLAIPSTVGEPAQVGRLSDRPDRLVVFGSAEVRSRAYLRERRSLEQTVHSLGVGEVLDIGPGAVAPGSVAGVRVRIAGQAARAEVSRLLLDSRIGFLAYPPDYLDKSTVFAGYLSHGVVPVCAWSGRRGRAPHEDEAWLRATARGVETRSKLESAASRARELYAERTISRHANLWRARLAWT